MTTPDVYVPSALRSSAKTKAPNSQVVYAIGFEPTPGSWGMTDGPVPNEKDMLETIPDHDGSCILRFNLDGTHDILWRWSTNKWMKADNHPF